MTNPTDEFTKVVESALSRHAQFATNDVFEQERGEFDRSATGEQDLPEALASIQSRTVELFTRLVGEDETFEPYSPEEVWKKAKNELRRELRTEIDQLIKDLTPSEKEKT